MSDAAPQQMNPRTMKSEKGPLLQRPQLHVKGKAVQCHCGGTAGHRRRRRCMDEGRDWKDPGSNSTWPFNCPGIGCITSLSLNFLVCKASYLATHRGLEREKRDAAHGGWGQSKQRCSVCLAAFSHVALGGSQDPQYKVTSLALSINQCIADAKYCD